MDETIEQQMKDSEMIFKQITSGSFDNFDIAQQTIVALYVPDMSISRSGISHALKRLQKHYEGKSAEVKLNFHENHGA